MTSKELMKMMPEGFKEACWEQKAMSRKRGIQDEESLMLLCLFYAYNHSLVEVGCYAQAKGIGKISDVGFMKRFAKCNDWFKWIIEHIRPSQLIQYPVPEQLKSYRVLAVDGSDIVTGGKTRILSHLHYAVDLFSLSCAGFKITPQANGETLKNFDLKPKDLVIGDRAYASITGIEYCLENGADFVLRIRNNAFKIYDCYDNEIKFVDLLKDVNRDYKSFTVYYKNHKNEKKALRLCAIKKTDEEIKISNKKLHQRESRKQCSFSDETKLSHQYFFVVTSLDDTFSAEQVLNLYRLRWQVEMVFKRYKSILKLGSIPTKKEESCKAWLNCKMIIILLCEKFISSMPFPPPDKFGEELVEGVENCLQLDF